MTDKQSRFCEEYLVDLNATAAYERAGYAATGAAARSGAARLLTKDNIAARIAELQEAVSERTEVTVDMVIEELRRIAFLDIRSLFTWDEDRASFVPSRDLAEEEAAAVQSIKAKTTTTRRGDDLETDITLEIKTYDKLAALDKLGKHLGMFTERVNVESESLAGIQDVLSKATEKLFAQ